nr:tetratricopeptide repeat protein [Ktedonobacteraceae bacterium]
PHEVVRRTLNALALTPRGQAPKPITPQPTESADQLIERGKALQAQSRHAEALPLFQRASQIAPQSFDAWFNLAYTLNKLHHYEAALSAHNRALSLQPNGNALWSLQRFQDALSAYNHALSLDPNFAVTWYSKGNALRNLQRFQDALAAFDHALSLDPNFTLAWYGKGNALWGLQRFQDALDAYDHALFP